MSDSDDNNACIAAEILTVKHTERYHTELAVIDQADTVFRIGFTDVCDEVSEKYLKYQCTVLLLNPVRVMFNDGVLGVEVDSLRAIKILPFRMAFPIDLSARICHANAARGLKRECYGCKARKYGLHRCPGCKLFYFCNRKCQNKAFKRGHRAECAALRDPDMNVLLTGKGDSLSEFSYFYLETFKD
ncbi:hypothetical protein BDV18DRAFT_159115 [Aspergillus unguis]